MAQRPVQYSATALFLPRVAPGVPQCSSLLAPFLAELITQQLRQLFVASHPTISGCPYRQSTAVYAAEKALVQLPVLDH